MIKRHRWTSAFLGALLVATLLVIGSLFVPYIAYTCAPNEYTHYKECAPHHLGPFVLVWIALVIDSHNGLVAALAGLAVAFFTYTLWKSAETQGSLTQQTIDLSREEFNATHRPKIRIRHVWPRTIVPDKQISIDLSFVNIGNATAVIHSFGVDFNVIKSGGRLPADMRPEHPTEGEKVSCGLGQTIRRNNIKSGGELNLARYTRIMQGQAHIFCFGVIEYSDDGPEETRKIKRTAFCRMFEAPGEHDRFGRFVRLTEPDPDYEYED